MQIVAEEGKMSGSVILLLDEIHRLDKAKQDFLLPHLEKGTIILIGATTSNPYHAINPAIRSRTQIFELEPLDTEDIKAAVHRALEDKERGLGDMDSVIDEAAGEHFVSAAHGDVRSALNALELAALRTEKDDSGTVNMRLQGALDCMQNPAFLHVEDGEMH